MNILNASFASKRSVKSSEDDFSNNGIGIVHFGTGAFHRAHQAVYTHDVLARSGGDWRILGVSLQSTQVADDLNGQDGIYTLAIRQENGLDLQLIKSIASVEAAVRSKTNIFRILASPDTHIVSMTVTEKAYGIQRETGKIDTSHPAIANDLENPEDPSGIIGMIVLGLKLRKEQGVKPFTVLCCDNLPQNGDLVKQGVLDFAMAIDEEQLADWIGEEGAFPNSMVDRITPATTQDLVEEVSQALGVKDRVPIETEPFSQWVIEDNFVTLRPEWEEAGALFVSSVEPYEHMKLRMLNGTHSLIAYMGFCSGHKYVRDVMADEKLLPLIKNHIKAAAQTLKPLEEILFDEYAAQLIERFKNPNIAHETYQIAMDGSQKMPQRIFQPAVDALNKGLSLEPFALATAAWIYYCRGNHDNNAEYALRDPRETELLNAFKSGKTNARAITKAFHELPDLIPGELAKSAEWLKAVETGLADFLQH